MRETTREVGEECEMDTVQRERDREGREKGEQGGA